VGVAADDSDSCGRIFCEKRRIGILRSMRHRRAAGMYIFYVDFGIFCSHNRYVFSGGFLLPHNRSRKSGLKIRGFGYARRDNEFSSFPYLDFMRRIISRMFDRLENGGNGDLGQLTRLVRRYTVEQQQVPKDLADLVALKYLAEIPVAPQGQRFVIDRRKVEVRLE
jgi:hypothetical protein